MDWMTLSIELMGVAIFCIWIVVPIREFGEIFRRLKRRRADDGDGEAGR